MFNGLGAYDEPAARAARTRQQAALLAQQIAEQKRAKEDKFERDKERERIDHQRAARYAQDRARQDRDLLYREELPRYEAQQPSAWREPWREPKARLSPRQTAASERSVRRRPTRLIDIDAEWDAWEARHPEAKRPGRGRATSGSRSLQHSPSAAAAGTIAVAGSAAAAMGAEVSNAELAPTIPMPTAATIGGRRSSAQDVSVAAPTSPQVAGGFGGIGATTSAFAQANHTSRPAPPAGPMSLGGRLAEDLRSIASNAMQDELSRLKRSCFGQREGLRSQAERLRVEASRLLVEQAHVPSAPLRMPRLQQASGLAPAPPALLPSGQVLQKAAAAPQPILPRQALGNVFNHLDKVWPGGGGSSGSSNSPGGASTAWPPSPVSLASARSAPPLAAPASNYLGQPPPPPLRRLAPPLASASPPRLAVKSREQPPLVSALWPPSGGHAAAWQQQPIGAKHLQAPPSWADFRAAGPLFQMDQALPEASTLVFPAAGTPRLIQPAAPPAAQEPVSPAAAAYAEDAHSVSRSGLSGGGTPLGGALAIGASNQVPSADVALASVPRLELKKVSSGPAVALPLTSAAASLTTGDSSGALGSGLLTSIPSPLAPPALPSATETPQRSRVDLKDLDSAIVTPRSLLGSLQYTQTSFATTAFAGGAATPTALTAGAAGLDSMGMAAQGDGLQNIGLAKEDSETTLHGQGEAPLDAQATAEPSAEPQASSEVPFDRCVDLATALRGASSSLPLGTGEGDMTRLPGEGGGSAGGGSGTIGSIGEASLSRELAAGKEQSINELTLHKSPRRTQDFLMSALMPDTGQMPPGLQLPPPLPRGSTARSNNSGSGSGDQRPAGTPASAVTASQGDDITAEPSTPSPMAPVSSSSEATGEAPRSTAADATQTQLEGSVSQQLPPGSERPT
eukprot:TRINITY_DN13774_c0_g1_i1.p1 TRINITY_DN13774_c0_g1~~TRINITY_DN13774_c0_g1_i1.p1  ORF type:complete len:910 (+),score=207.37 TRINITY_DN13774_c0_g1_i1:124-2853(+)